MKKQFIAFRGSPRTELTLEFASNLVQATIGKALNYRDRLSKPSELELDDDVSFTAIKLV